MTQGDESEQRHPYGWRSGPPRMLAVRDLCEALAVLARSHPEARLLIEGPALRFEVPVVFSDEDMVRLRTLVYLHGYAAQGVEFVTGFSVRQ